MAKSAIKILEKLFCYWTGIWAYVNLNVFESPKNDTYGTCSKKKVAVHDIVKIEKSNFVLFENEASYKEFFFACKCFKSCYQILCVTFSVKIWSKEAQGYRSNILLLLYQYAFIDVFFRKSIIEIWKINPWRTNSWKNDSWDQALTEIVSYFCNIRTKIRKYVMKFD